MIKLISILVSFYYLFVFLTYIYSHSISNDLIIYILDVGQGDSIVVTSSNKSLVIDGGPSYDASDFVYDLSNFHSCSSVSILLTHPHFDHLAGLNRILAFCEPAAVYTTSVDYKSKSFEQFQITTANLNTRYLKAGDKFKIGEVQFYVLWPTLKQLQTKTSNINNYSIVLLLDYGEYEALFTGDIEIDALAKINIEEYEYLIDGRLELYKVSHHGSFNGLSKGLVEHLEPETAIISVGENSYGHPSQKVLEFLGKLGTEVRRTDLEGDIRIKVKKNNASM